MAKWVQRFDGKGPKYKVEDCDEYYWSSYTLIHGTHPYLLKADYTECAPPERWDVMDLDTGGDIPVLYVKWTDERGVRHSTLVGSLNIPGHQFKFDRVDNNTFKILKKVIDNSAKP